MITGIVMPTIRGTGSLFLQNLLSPPYERVTLRGEQKPFSLVFDHLYPQHIPHFERWFSVFSVMVMPIRDPMTVAATWAKRGEKFEHFFFMWERWAEYAPFAHIIPVDLEGERDSRLERLSKEIGLELSTDWAPFNQTKTSKGGTIPQEDVQTLYNIPEIRSLYV